MRGGSDESGAGGPTRHSRGGAGGYHVCFFSQISTLVSENSFDGTL